MGVLTQSRKRCLGSDHNRPPFLSPHNLLFDLASEPGPSPPPPSKKAKIQLDNVDSLPLPPSTPRTRPPPDMSPAPAPALRRFPPAAPLLRPIHGPQRIIKAFGLGSANLGRSQPPKVERDRELSNLVSLYREAKNCAPFTPWLLEKQAEASNQGFDGDGHGIGEGLELDLYKRLVKSAQENNSTESHADLSMVDVLKPSAAILDLTYEAQLVDEPSRIHGVSLEVTDLRNTAESTPAREGKLWMPRYKELYKESIKRYDSKLRSLDVELQLTLKKISSICPTYKEDLHEALVPLTAEEEDEVDHALHGKHRSELLVKHEASNIEITREVLQCLSPHSWLNDEVINLYLELLKEREAREPKKFLKCHFFNTFFFKKLVSGRNSYDFKAVRRWTTQKKLGYTLLECDKIFVPIHKTVHYCLAVIDVRNERFQYLDSLGAVDMDVLQVLAKYLRDEVKDKNNKQIDTHSWKQETVPGLPLQQNGLDCGMFILKYADFYSRGSKLCFSQDNMTYFRKRTVKEILRLRAE